MAKEKFMLSALPAYDYPLNIACPTCFRPLDSHKRKDARCDECRKSKELFPVNYVRVQRKKSEEDEDEDRKSRRYDDD